MQCIALWELQCSRMLDKLLILVSVCLPEISQFRTCCVLPSHGREVPDRTSVPKPTFFLAARLAVW